MAKLSGSLKLTLASAAFVAAAAIFLRRGSQDGPQKYFYDLSERRLYTRSVTVQPPDAGVGGAPGDGYEAQVVRCPRCAPGQQRVAYLTTLSSELKQQLRAAEDSDAAAELLTRSFVFAHTMVRTLDDPAWHALSTDEGKRIRDSWQGTCREHGEPEDVALP